MKQASDERLGTEPLGRLIFSMAIPAVIAQLVNLLYSIVDRIYIGHIAEAGGMALTGLGLCTPILLIVSAFASFAGSGGAPLAAMELGRGDREKASRILSMSMLMLVCISVALTCVLLCVKLPLLRFFGASDATIGYADDYLTVYLCGTLFVQLALGLNNFISGQGQPKIAMLSVLIGAAANIVLDPIFIFLFNMGVRGAALATIISQAMSAAWVLRFLLSEKSVITVKKDYLKPNFEIIGRITSLGISPFIIQSTESLIAIVFTSGLQKYGGDLYVGTYAILQSTTQMVFTPGHGFSFGAQPIISYNFGAGNYARVKRCFLTVTGILFAFSLLFYVFVRFCPMFIAGLFTSDPELAALTAEKLPVYMFGMSVFGLQMGVQSTFLGMGQAKVSLFIACLRKIILLTPLALLLPLAVGVDGIYLSAPISDMISATCAIVLFTLMARKLLRTPPENTSQTRATEQP